MNRLNRYTLGAFVATLVAAAVVYALGGSAEHMGIVLAFGTTLLATTPSLVSPKRTDDDDDDDAGGEVLVDGPPTRPERRSAARNTMLAVPVTVALRIGASLALALTLSACSPSALQTHATIALVASHTLEVTRASALTACAALRDTCAADATCIEHTRTDCLAVADAQDTAVAAVTTYVDAVQLAALADEGRVMEALRFALEAASRAWASLGERLAVVGIALPSLGGVQ